MSRSAIAFVTEVVAAHGRDLGGERIEVPLSQAEMARRQGCSAGTVAYYLRSAGDVVVSRRRGRLVIDLAALDAAASNLTTRAGRCVPPHTSGPRHLRVAEASLPAAEPRSSASTSVLTGDQVVDVVSTLARCLSQISSELAALGNQLLVGIVAPRIPRTMRRTHESSRHNPRLPRTSRVGFLWDQYLGRKKACLPHQNQKPANFAD